MIVVTGDVTRPWPVECGHLIINPCNGFFVFDNLRHVSLTIVYCDIAELNK